MKPTEILMGEHRIIEKVLDCLEVIAERASSQGQVDAEAAAQAIDFFRTFADRYHHEKEETFLFPMLETKGLPREGGPIGVMLAEHDQGRTHVGAMAEAIKDPSTPACEQFVRHARAFVQLLRQHIQKEDTCLFSIANSALADEDQANLSAEFANIERSALGQEAHSRCVELADQLADRLGISSKAPGSCDASGTGCCGGETHSIAAAPDGSAHQSEKP